MGLNTDPAKLLMAPSTQGAALMHPGSISLTGDDPMTLVR
jgi:hypothetical protein